MQELLKHFHELSLHPKNAKELKSLILQLAMQGRLTADWRAQNPDLISGENSAENLLGKIKVEKAKLVKEKRIKKEKALPSISEDNIPFKLPSSWIWSYLADLGSTNVGLTYKPSHKVNDGVPVLRSSNIQNGRIDLTDLVRVNTNYREKDLIKSGDLLICARNGSKKLVGKCAIVEDLDEITVFGAFMAIFRSDFNDYIKLFIESPTYRNRLEGVSTTTINQITQGNLKSTFIPFPSVNEQKEIVRIVEILFQEVEALENLTENRIELKKDYVTSALSRLAKNNSKAEWRALKPQFHEFFNEFDNIKKIRETILQLAVQGKLSAKWRVQNPALISGENSAENLLKEIKAEKTKLIKEKKIKNEKALPPIADDEIPYELPKSWAFTRLGTYTHNFGQKKPVSNFEYIDVASIDNHLGIIKSDLNIITPEEAPSRARKIVKKGCVLYSTVRPYLLNIARVDREFKNEAIASTAFSILNPMLDCSPSYLYYLLRSPYFIEYVESYSKGVAYPAINDKNLQSAIIPIPPLEEQKAIVQKINALMELCDQLEKEVENGKRQIEELMQSVLKEVFEGEKIVNEMSAV